MATGTEGGRSQPQPLPQPTHRGAPAPNIGGSAVSPPSKRELTSWWKKFTKTTDKQGEKVNQVPSIFGVPLAESIRYANVAISLTNEQGESFIYGYVPIVVAKCGVFLKEKATDVEGIFRLSGSVKRINDLQHIFDSPDRYGKGLDWTGYTVHDAANILRRYLNNLPQPIVPLDQYDQFRYPLRDLQKRLENHPPGQAPPEISAADHAIAVAAYQKLITELPALNRQLLLYILDLLAVFASKSDLNRMTAANLSAIFQPGIIRHPKDDMAVQEYRLSQDVLIFLIENQDNFLIGMSGTGLDEKTQKHVESGAPSLKSPKSNIGRSASNASAGADSLRKYGIRRNVSVSSHASKERTSPNVSNPGTPVSPPYTPVNGSIGVSRSNTVPSKRSPAVGQHRFQRVPDPALAETAVVGSPAAETPSARGLPENAGRLPVEQQHTTQLNENLNTESTPAAPPSEPTTVPFPEIPPAVQSAEVLQSSQHAQPMTLQIPQPQPSSNVQTRERKISNLFSKSPIFGPSDPQQNQSPRQPRKLQKRQKIPGSMIESAQSSATSLHNDDPFHTPLVSPGAPHVQGDPMATAAQIPANPSTYAHAEFQNELSPPHAQDIQGCGQKSPATSLRSGTSMTDPSDFDALDDPITKAEKKRSRWRFSSSARKPDDSPLVPPPLIGQMTGARNSNSSIGSSNRPRHSFTADTYLAQPTITDSSSTGQPSVLAQSSHDSYEQSKDVTTEPEKKGLFGKWKAKMAQNKEERRERSAEKERAKSPQRMTGDNVSSRQSLSAIAHDHFKLRGRSFDKSREDVLVAGGEPTETKRGSISSNAAATTALPAATSSHSAQTVAPQTTSGTSTLMPPPPPPPAAVATIIAVNPSVGSEPSTTTSSQTNTVNIAPSAVVHSMPVVREEPRLEVNTQVEPPAPDSLQHTPTEIKSPPLGQD